jgi:ribosomal protein L11 methyltransferase
MNDLLHYSEVILAVNPADPGREILTAELAELGFDSFEDTPDGLKAWIMTSDFDPEAVSSLVEGYRSLFSITYTFGEVEPVNWNEEWEKNYAPVVIAGQCSIRAPFHEPRPDLPFDIIVEPKMSFGTAHHDTTALMIVWLLELDVNELEVMDMGCGTGVLAILASLRGASSVTAIDNYVWAWANTLENAQRNAIQNLEAIHGDVDALKGITNRWDVVLANINRNVLMDDLQHYTPTIRKGGLLIISGFFDADITLLTHEAIKHQLSPCGEKNQNGWASLCFKKEW